MRTTSTLGALCLAATLLQTAAFAQLPGVGSRALGMGGAYTAVADDVYAPYWNPAGVTQLKGYHASLANVQAREVGPNNLFDLLSHFPSDTASQITFAQKYSRGVSQADATADFAVATHNYAISLIPAASARITPTNVAGALTNVNLNGTYGFQVLGTLATKIKGTSFGTNLKLVNYRPTSINVTLPNSAFPTVTTTQGDTTNAFAMDLGMLHHCGLGVTVGAILRNLIKPNDEADYPTRLTVGAAWRNHADKLLVSGDLDNLGGRNFINLGVEYKPVHMVALRGGLYRNHPTIGLGIANILNVGYSTDQTMISAGVSF